MNLSCQMIVISS